MSDPTRYIAGNLNSTRRLITNQEPIMSLRKLSDFPEVASLHERTKKLESDLASIRRQCQELEAETVASRPQILADQSEAVAEGVLEAGAAADSLAVPHAELQHLTDQIVILERALTLAKQKEADATRRARMAIGEDWRPILRQQWTELRDALAKVLDLVESQQTFRATLPIGEGFPYVPAVLPPNDERLFRDRLRMLNQSLAEQVRRAPSLPASEPAAANASLEDEVIPPTLPAENEQAPSPAARPIRGRQSPATAR
jgi:hypothetical protein